MIKTQKQLYFTQALMQEVDILLNQIDRGEVDSIDDLLNQATTGLSTTQTLITFAAGSLALVGVTMAIPTAGLSMAGAATAVTMAQTTYNTFKFVQRSFTQENNTLSLNESNAAEKRFIWKIFIREAAEAIAVCYGHYINTIAKEGDLIELAKFASACILQKIRETALTHVLLNSNVILDALRQTAINTLDVFNTRQMETKRTYARPRVACYSLSAGKIHCTFYASDKKNKLPSEGSTSKKYGYMALPFQEAFSYIKKRNAIQKQLSHDIAKSIQAQLSIYHIISEHEIKDYLLTVQSRQSQTIISLNTFLSQRLGMSVIATCHHDMLQGMDLSYADFSGVNFRRANLSNCLLEYSKWESADVDEAKFGSSTKHISLKGAHFNNVQAEKTQWINVDFSESSFLKASLNGASLQRCVLGTMQHVGCNWEWATLEEMQLPEKNFLDQLSQLETKVNSLFKRIEVLEQGFSSLPAYQSGSSTPDNMPELLHPIYIAYQTAFSRPSLKKAMNYYVEPDTVPYRTSGQEQRQNLFTQFQHFLSHSEKLFLLHGDVGAGKSFAARVLQHRLWQQWLNKESTIIPLLIELKQIQDGTLNFIVDCLKKLPYSYTAAQIFELKKNYSFLIILDGWDECGTQLVSSPLLQLCSIHEWNAKVLLTARTEWLEKQFNYHRLLSTATVGSQTLESFIAPLTPEQINGYLERRYQAAKQPWTYYRDLLCKQKDLQSMIQSPVMLHIICEGDILSMLETSRQEKRQHTRIWLYETFLQAWFKREILKPYDLENEPQVDNTLLLHTFNYYTQELAFMMFIQNTLLVERQYRDPIVSAHYRESSGQEKDPWSWFFDYSDNPYIQQAQRSCPLVLDRVENIQRYQFIHKSFMEYAASGALWEALQNISLQDNSNNSSSIVVWNHRFLTEELGILAFLAERLQISPTREIDEQRLLVLLYASRDYPSHAKASSSAASLLNRTEFNFSERARDLSDLYLSYADFTKAPLAFVNFQRSDLRYSNFDKATLIQTLFQESQLANVYFSPVLSISHTQNKIITLATHPKYKDLVAYAEGADVVIMRATDGHIIGKYQGHASVIHRIAWSPSGETIASGSFDHTIRLWIFTHLNTKNACSLILRGHKGPIYSVAWSPDSKKLASGSGDNCICVWDVAQQSCVLMKGHAGPVYDVSWSYDGQRLASCSADKTIRIWYPNAAGDINSALEKQDSQVNVVAWLSDGRLISGNTHGAIRVWLPADNQYTELFPMNEIAVTSIACSVQGGLLAVGNKNGYIFIFDTTRQLHDACIATFHDHEDCVNSVVWLSDQHIISGSADKSIRTVDVTRAFRDNLQAITATGLESKIVTCVSWSSNGLQLAIGHGDGSIQIASYSNHVFHSPAIELSAHIDWIVDLAWSADSTYLASGSRDYTILIWKKNAANQYSLLTTLAEHQNWISKVSWSPDNTKLVSSSFDSTVRIWNMTELEKSPQVVQSEILHKHLIATSVCWSSDGKQLATGGRDSKICLWDMTNVATITCLAILQGHTRGVESLVWSPNDELLASSGHGTTIRIWNTITKQCLQILRGHQGCKHLFWQAQGRWLISQSTQCLCFWDAHNNYQVLAFNFGAMSMSNYGFLLALSYNRAVYIFDWTQISTVVQMAVFGQQDLWIQGCNLENAQQLSSYTQQWLQQQGAIGRQALFRDQATPPYFFSRPSRERVDKNETSTCIVS